MKLAEATSALMLLLAAASSSAGAEQQFSGPPPLTCVAFESDKENPNSLQMGQCLTAGDAICSTRGSWALGIDPADRMIKLWEGNRVLFASSEWINAEAFCIGGNTADYAPHEHAWYDDDVPYLFVSYDFGRSKAFLDCGNGRPSAGDVAAAAADDQRGHLEINHIAEIDATRMPDAPIVAFLLGANTSAFWSIDAWGTARTDSDCQWRADPLGFMTTETAVGQGFGHVTLIDAKEEDTSTYEDAGKEDKRTSIMRPNLRPGDAKKQAQNEWDTSINIIQPRKAPSGKGKLRPSVSGDGDGDGDDNKHAQNESIGVPLEPRSVGKGKGKGKGKGLKSSSTCKSSKSSESTNGKGKGEGKGSKSPKGKGIGKGKGNGNSKSPKGKGKGKGGCDETPDLPTSLSVEPSAVPSTVPSDQPSLSSQPSDAPSDQPSLSSQPSDAPSDQPSLSSQPSDELSDQPSLSSQPSDAPSDQPSLSSQPSTVPSDQPSLSSQPSNTPSDQPSLSSQPSDAPSDQPSVSSQPSDAPSDQPSVSSQPSDAPSNQPSLSSQPSDTPSDQPSVSSQPSDVPSDEPSLSSQPSDAPSDQPSVSSQPSDTPSDQPSVSSQPSDTPSDQPSLSSQPSDAPSVFPSSLPSQSPSLNSECNVVQFPFNQTATECDCNGEGGACSKGCCQAQNGARTCEETSTPSSCKKGIADPSICAKDERSQNGPCDAQYPVCCTDAAMGANAKWCCVATVGDCPDNDDPSAPPLVCPSRSPSSQPSS